MVPVDSEPSEQGNSLSESGKHSRSLSERTIEVAYNGPIPIVSQWLETLQVQTPFNKWVLFDGCAGLLPKFEAESALSMTVEELGQFTCNEIHYDFKLNMREFGVVYQ